MAINIIEHNPMLKKPLLALLTAAEPHAYVNRLELEARALETWSNQYTQSPSVSIDILVRNEALIEQIIVDGGPYNGTLEDLQLDDNVTEDAVIESRISITDEGRALITAYAPATTLQALITNKPHYHNVFETILHACNVEAGCSCADLEQTLSTMPQLQPNPSTQQTAVYPQYFIDALESAGGIFWNNSWHTTDTGKTVIAA